MKKTPQILLILVMIFACNIGVASTNGTEKKSETQEQDQEGRRKSNQSMMRPDGDVTPQQNVSFQEDSKPELEIKEESKPNEKVDTVQDDSVSKYNFIFYFLYKFKYEEEAP